MVYRVRRRILQVVLFFPLAGVELVSGCREVSEPGVREGQRFPFSVEGVPARGGVLVWIASAADCVGCTAPTYALRRFQANAAGSVPLLLVLIDGDSAAARRLLDGERLVADIQGPMTREARAAVKRLQVPALIAVRDGVVRGVWVGARLRKVSADSIEYRLRG
jgi:hypothetical protein